ncbi:DNA methyltransferase [Helicobacter suis]|uniref:DNA methyltransferase n=1 Tax=Helicobacter suis TaxID=104628 RepID=UPI0013D6B665|nr:DNA methyltransferase [Helicobacter suis]
MFPPSLPHYFIEKYTRPGDIVYDPFCGRGTSVLEGCRLGRIGVGNDLSPLAFCLSKAKF